VAERSPRSSSTRNTGALGRGGDHAELAVEVELDKGHASTLGRGGDRAGLVVRRRPARRGPRDRGRLLVCLRVSRRYAKVAWAAAHEVGGPVAPKDHVVKAFEIEDRCG
jgi:hypothetical protein